jgi:hypothetical protein
MPVRVIKSYQAQYPDPIVIHRGETVSLGRRDAEYPGWIWATSLLTGKSGWVPEHFLSPGESPRAIARRDYSARELDVVEGAVVSVIEEVLGWSCVVTESGDSGWVPQSHLAALASPVDLAL